MSSQDILILQAELDSEKEKVRMLRQALRLSYEFTQRVTHWEEGRPDRHDALTVQVQTLKDT